MRARVFLHWVVTKPDAHAQSLVLSRSSVTSNSPCVRRGQSIRGSVIPMYLEFLEAIHAFQCSKPLQWNLAGAGDKLEKLGTIGLVKRAQRSPEPLNLKNKELRGESENNEQPLLWRETPIS